MSNTNLSGHFDVASDPELKEQVRRFWDAKSCGETYAQGRDIREQFETQARERYLLQPEIQKFADFSQGSGKDVLEIGVGMGADYLEWAKCGPRSLCGIDLTERAVSFTRERLDLYGLRSNLQVADAEHLPYSDNAFDIVYSWGVLHHSPNTAQAISEVYRILRRGGTAKIMIYHRYSLVGYMLWARYALLAGHPFQSLDEIYAQHLESPGTKAFTVTKAELMFSRFSEFKAEVKLSMGDLLEGAVGQKHNPAHVSIAKALWPRWFIRHALRGHGLELLIAARK
jgi:ubiquinone/menaquinone biosynthesis C-methylase UbiE